MSLICYTPLHAITREGLAVAELNEKQPASEKWLAGWLLFILFGYGKAFCM